MRTGIVMSGRDVALAVLTSMALGLVFVAIRIGLRTFSPFLWTAGCFILGSLCLLAWRPALDVSWRWVLMIGASLLTGRSALLISGIDLGMPAGLTSLILQMQVAFTAILAALVLGEIPSPGRLCCIALSIAGLAIVGLEHGIRRGSAVGLLSVLAGAAAFAVGNVGIKVSGSRRPMALILWAQLTVPLPLLSLSAACEGGAAFRHAWEMLSLAAVGAMIFTALTNLVGFGVWSRLLLNYGPSTVSPFALLVPVFGMTGTAFAVGEPITLVDVIVGVLILSGLYLVIRAERSVLIATPAEVVR